MTKRYFSAAMALCVSLTLVPSTAYAADADAQSTMPEFYSSVEDILGPMPPPDPGLDDTTGGGVVLPDEGELHSNEDFMQYDPHYPTREQYGDYTFRVPDLKGRLTFSNSNNKAIGTLFAPGTSPQGGWYDATKNWSNDTGLCFAASSSNLIAWYLEQYKQLNPDDTTAYVTDAEAIFNRFRNGWKDEGGDQKEALSWYFTGGFPSGGDKPNNGGLSGREDGGYLHGQILNNNSENWSEVSYKWEPQEVFRAFGSYVDNNFPFIEEVGGHTGNGAFSTLEKFSEYILRQLHYGVCTISIIKDSTSGGSGHAITLWGADYDVNTGFVTAIHVTDSDDKQGMFKVNVQRGSGSNGGVRLVSYPYHPPIGGDSRPFTTIRDSIVMYWPGVIETSQEYTGESAVIDTLIPDSDGRGVDVQVSNISKHALEYGYSYDQRVENVTRWQTNSHFSGLEPDQYYFFARVKETSGHKAGGASAPEAYRVTTPSPAPQESVASLSFGTAAFRPYKDAHQYIWYGTEHGSDESGSEEPILWRVLDTKANQKDSDLFLLSDKLYGSGADGDLSFSDQPPYNNSYQGSAGQRWCKNFEGRRFAPWEQNAIQSTTKTDASYTGGISFAEVPDILSSDKVFLPSAEEIFTALDTTESRQGRYRGSNHGYWLRSPVADGSGDAGYINSAGQIAQHSTLHEHAARPAFHLDGSQVLYTAAVGNGQFSDFTGIEKIQTVQSSDFRLVLKDVSRAFRVTIPAITGQSGGSITLPYEGAQTSHQNNEYISVILIGSDGNPAYYGKVALVQAVNGAVSFKLPADLGDGTYTLKVFNEQYNGERESGVASAFSDVNLTVSGQAALNPVAEVDINVPAPIAGQSPQRAESTGIGFTVVKTEWMPVHDTFQANTHYDVSVSVKAESDHMFTPATVFKINGKVIMPAVHGEEYTVTYTDFPATADGGSGGGTGGGGAGGGGGGSIGDLSPETTEPEITDGPDGSKIETVTKPDGTKVQTTTWPNGDKAVTEMKTDGSVTTNVQKADGTTAKASTDEKGHTKAEVMLSQKAENEAKESGKPVALPIPAVKPGATAENAPVIKVESASGEKVSVTIPASPLSFGTVAVIVHKDGTEEVVRKAVNTQNGVTLAVENGSVVKIVDNAKVFSDTSGHWAKNSIDFVTSHELYAGTSETTFSPNVGMTRGMLAVVLHNLENNPESEVNTAFADVKDGAWYVSGVRWAAEQGIVSGYGDGKFGPNDQLNREQLAVMLYRYAGTPAHNGTVTGFQDANAVSAYAQEAMAWAIENGIISGTGNNTLNPKGTATRAQVATMLMRLVDIIG